MTPELQQVDQNKQDSVRAAARMLLQTLTPKQMVAVINRESNISAHEDDQSTPHPMTSFTLGEQEWGEFRSYYLDGGGVPDTMIPLEDGRHLHQVVLDAIVAGDQATFWPAIITLAKSCHKERGLIQKLPNGGVAMGPTGIPV